jgi:hypothetical protein
MYVLGSKFDHKLAHHLTDSNKALDSVLLLAEHNETLLTCEETTHYVEIRDNYICNSEMQRRAPIFLEKLSNITRKNGYSGLVLIQKSMQ